MLTRSARESPSSTRRCRSQTPTTKESKRGLSGEGFNPRLLTNRLRVRERRNRYPDLHDACPGPGSKSALDISTADNPELCTADDLSISGNHRKRPVASDSRGLHDVSSNDDQWNLRFGSNPAVSSHRVSSQPDAVVPA